MRSKALEIRTQPRQWLPLLVVALLATALANLAAADTAFVRLEADGLQTLGPDAMYEGWLIVNEMPVSTGKFNVGPAGRLDRPDVAVQVDDLSQVTAFVLTIEPVPDPSPQPSPVHLLAGAFNAGTATATVDSPMALGTDFGTATGSYILNAPSGGDMAQYFNGIWWLDPDAGPGPVLELPQLPGGWMYEGWVVGPDGPVSTDRFSAVSGVDSDGAGFHSGPYSAPPFPGQDFVTPPTDLTSGYAAVISVEPEPDDSPGPFLLKPLVDPSIDDVGAGVLQPMQNMTDSLPSMTATMMQPAAGGEMAQVHLKVDGLIDLGPEAIYEGWLMVDGLPVSTGTFTVDADGVQSQTYFPTMVSSLDAVTAFVLTIEPVPDPSPMPSPVHVLGGDFVHRRARLSIDSPFALGTDFSDASGAYILAAPSAGDGGDYRNGIWWLDPAGAPDPAYDLPELPGGWVYEGWVGGPDGPISTGRFTSVSGADSDGAGPASGPNAAPPFPGQDFVDPAIDLTSGYAAVLTVEPEPDNSAAPFAAIKPLVDPHIDDVGMGMLQPMHSNPDGMPTGWATLMWPTDIPAGGRVEGVGGAQWYTDVDGHNAGGMPASVFVQLLPAGGANAMPQTVEMTLPAGGTAHWHDVYGSLFDFTGTGALRFLTDSDMVQFDSRTFADTGAGTYGQGIGPHSMADAVRFGAPRRLLQLSQGAAFRTNLGFENLTGMTTEVLVELRNGDGVLVASQTVSLAPFEQLQLNRVFPAATAVGTATVTVTTPGGAVLTYASVVDNATDDPTFVRAQ